MKLEIKVNPKEYDSDDVVIRDGKFMGTGYKPKEGEDRICLMRCPKCGRENYAMNVTTGVCTWCGFDANKLLVK